MDTRAADTVQRVTARDQLLAIIVRARFRVEGIEFFTPSSFSQQLGYMNRPADYVIPAHKHNHNPRQVDVTNEVLLIRSGRVRVDFYDRDDTYVSSTVLEGGDVILLVSGGHGFRMLEATEMIEVKQGPFVGAEDKTQIPTVAERTVRTDPA